MDVFGTTLASISGTLVIMTLTIAALALVATDVFRDATQNRCLTALPSPVLYRLSSEAAPAQLAGPRADWTAILRSDGTSGDINRSMVAPLNASAWQFVGQYYERYCDATQVLPGVGRAWADLDVAAQTALQIQENTTAYGSHVYPRVVEVVSTCPERAVCAGVKPPPAFSFHSFDAAMLTVYRLAARGIGSGRIITATVNVSGWSAILFFVTVLIIVSFLVLSLFVAIVRGSFMDRRAKAAATAAAQSTARATAAARATQQQATPPTETPGRKESARHLAQTLEVQHDPDDEPTTKTSSFEGHRVTAQGTDNADGTARTTILVVPNATHVVRSAGHGADDSSVAVQTSVEDFTPGSSDASSRRSSPGSLPSIPHRLDSTTSQLESTVPLAIRTDCPPTEKFTVSASRVARIRARVLQLVASTTFEVLVCAVVVANTVTLSIDHFRISHSMLQTLGWLEFIFTVFFAVEMALVWFGHGTNGYFFGPGCIWRRIDCAIVLSTTVDVIVQLSTSGCPFEPCEGGGMNVSFLRAFRVLRLVRLVRRNQKLIRLVGAVFQSLAAVANLLLLFAVVVVVFTILGMQLFYAADPAIVSASSSNVTIASTSQGTDLAYVINSSTYTFSRPQR